MTYDGVDLAVGNGTVDFTGQYLLRRDSDPALVGAADEVDTEGFIAEVVVTPQCDLGRHFFTLLHNRVDSDLAAHDLESVTSAATYLLARNLRLTAEYTRDLERNSRALKRAQPSHATLHTTQGTILSAVEEADPGTVIELQTSDSGSKNDVPEWLDEAGHDMLEVVDHGDYWSMYVEVN